jgi:hypothetical protein
MPEYLFCIFTGCGVAVAAAGLAEPSTFENPGFLANGIFYFLQFFRCALCTVPLDGGAIGLEKTVDNLSIFTTNTTHS